VAPVRPPLLWANDPPPDLLHIRWPPRSCTRSSALAQICLQVLAQKALGFSRPVSHDRSLGAGPSGTSRLIR